MLDHLKEGFADLRDKMAVPTALAFLSYFFGLFAVGLSLYTFANAVNEKKKK